MPFVYAIIKMLLRICRFRQPYAGMAELADVQVLGSCAIGVWVQIPLPAPQQKRALEQKLSTHKDNINDRLEQCQIKGRDLL